MATPGTSFHQSLILKVSHPRAPVFYQVDQFIWMKDEATEHSLETYESTSIHLAYNFPG